MKILRFITLFISLQFLFFTSSHSTVINNVKISGNQYVNKDTILSKIFFIPKKDYSDQDLNDMQKKLFDSGFFEKVNFQVVNDILNIYVKENPIIDFFYIYGDKNKERVEKLYEIVSLKSGNIYSDSILVEDIQKINEFYKFNGFYNAKVEPTIKKINGKKINISIKITKNEKFLIKNIFFIGNKIFKSSILKDAISSSQDNWWKFLTNTSLLSEARIAYDKKLLKDFYFNEGYYDAQIVNANVEILSNGLANIIFSIEAGEQYNFGKLNFNKLNIFKDDQNSFLNNLSKLIDGKIYSTSKIKKLKSELNNFVIFNKLQNIDFELKENKIDKLKINIDIVFYEKSLPLIKNILVKGNSITEEKVIRNNLIFAEGDFVSDYKISKSKDNLESLLIFKKVDIIREKKENNQTEIIINVEEQPTGSIMGGVGIGSNEAAISFELTERNFLGSNITFNSGISIGTQKVIGDIVIINPDYKDTGYELKNYLYARNTNYESVGYESTSIGDDISTNYQIYDDIYLNVGAGVDYDNIKASSGASDVYKKQEGKYSTIKTFYGFSNDKRNRRFQTSDGYITGFSQALAVPPSDIPYLKNNLYGRYYHSFNKDYILNLRAGASNILGLDSKDVKLSDRLFLSSKELRGFEPRGVGPVEGSDHVGGNYKAYMGLSSTFPNPLPEKWNATTLFFLDAGNVWGVDYDSSKDSDSIRSSAGVALDWISPLGPISFSFSNTIKKTSTDNDQNFSFQIGSTF